MEPVDIDRVYRELPLDRIPWNAKSPPDALVELVRNGTVLPCRTIDLGCGAGNYAVWLAGLGFDVTGADSSPTAIRIARENAGRKNVRCTFVVADLLGNLREIEGTFDFAFDWELLHHIFPEDRKRYVKNVYRLTNPGATYFSVCFSEKDPQFGGAGKIRRTPLGTVLYFSSESEIRELLLPYFVTRELKTIQVSGKSGPHAAIYALSERR
jgi:SAM-dependent methyltransferase